MNVSWEAFMVRLRADEEPPRWSLALGLLLLAAYFVIQIIMLPFITSIIDPAAIQTGVVSPLAINLGAALGGALMLAVLWAALRRPVRGPIFEALRLERGTLSTWLVVLFALGAVIFIDFVPLLFQTVGLPVTLTGMEGVSSATWMAAILFAAFIGPVVMTLLLQGVLYPALAARWSNVQAILFTALAEMALVVALGDPGDAVLWLQAFLTGVYVTVVRAHQKSTWAALVTRVIFGIFTLAKAARLFL